MALTKLEIQQMLREMNVKFGADEPYEALKQRLQKENHSLWLKSVAAAPGADGKPARRVIRKRRKEADDPTDTPERLRTPGARSRSAHAADSQSTTARRRPMAQAPRRSPIEKPAAGKPWKQAAAGVEPFNRKKRVFQSVLRRSHMHCESCNAPTPDQEKATFLQPYQILPSDQGGEHSTKNVVALCPACLASLQATPDPKIIKELKRKTRSKLYDALQVVRKKKGPGRHGSTPRG